MAGSESLTFQYLVAVDIEGFSRRCTAQQARAQSALVMALARAAESAGLERERWYRQPRGDGELAVLPQDVDGLSLVADYPRELAASLAGVNRANRERRLRLRLAIHHGAVAPGGPLGRAGKAVVEITRLVDAEIGRQWLLQRSDLDIALIVSATVYGEIVQSELRNLDPGDFRRAEVEEKEVSYVGYLYESNFGIAEPGVPGARASMVRLTAVARETRLPPEALPGLLRTVTVITGEMRGEFASRGFVVVPGVIGEGLLLRARDMVAGLLEREPVPEGHVGPVFRWPSFGAEGHPLLDLYRQTGIAELAGQLLRPGLALRDPDFAQLAVTVPPWPHRPGGPHVDGLTPAEPDGRPGTFSMLAGVWLTDHAATSRGNLWVWPGTHLRFGRYLAEHGTDVLNADKLEPGPYPPIELGEPVQATGPAGSVLLAHYLLGHGIGNHDGPVGGPRRETIYYRLQADGHRRRWREAVTSPLSEFRQAEEFRPAG